LTSFSIQGGVQFNKEERGAEVDKEKTKKMNEERERRKE
jgi:hypothetical protein